MPELVGKQVGEIGYGYVCLELLLWDILTGLKVDGKLIDSALGVNVDNHRASHGARNHPLRNRLLKQ